MPRWLIIIVSAIALLLAGAWVWSFATKTGVLFSASDYMVSDLHNVEPDPTATDEPVGKLCEYFSYDGVHTLILLDRDEADALESARQTGDRLDPRLESVSIVESWYEAKCPATDRVPG
jgi:hypothetical protein